MPLWSSPLQVKGCNLNIHLWWSFFNFKKTLGLHHLMTKIISLKLKEHKFMGRPKINCSSYALYGTAWPLLLHSFASRHHFTILDTKPTDQTFEFCHRLAQSVFLPPFHFLYQIHELTMQLLRKCVFCHGWRIESFDTN